MVLSKSFIFRRISRGRYGYTDNRAGVTLNFFAYLISGRAEIVARDRRISLKAGDAFFIPAGVFLSVTTSFTAFLSQKTNSLLICSNIAAYSSSYSLVLQ